MARIERQTQSAFYPDEQFKKYNTNSGHASRNAHGATAYKQLEEGERVTRKALAYHTEALEAPNAHSNMVAAQQALVKAKAAANAETDPEVKEELDEKVREANEAHRELTATAKEQMVKLETRRAKLMHGGRRKTNRKRNCRKSRGKKTNRKRNCRKSRRRRTNRKRNCRKSHRKGKGGTNDAKDKARNRGFYGGGPLFKKAATKKAAAARLEKEAAAAARAAARAAAAAGTASKKMVNQRPRTAGFGATPRNTQLSAVPEEE